ncbi:MAG TPA: hypothetical protein VEL76_05550, partial [Gemmataceae bacterium]|nr:hypothetical protein [Gemmataceae bacterium]
MTGLLEFLGQPLLVWVGLVLFLVTWFRHGTPGFFIGGAYAFAAWCVFHLSVAIAGDTGGWIVGGLLLLGWVWMLAQFKPVSLYLGQTRLVTMFKIKELRQKIVITFLFLAIYRIGFHIPLPMIDQREMARAMKGSEEGILGMISMFSGGSLSQSTIFGLGIMPYISASIIFQLLASVYPPLEKLQKEGESGRKKINEYTRYATVLICFIQAWFWVQYIAKPRDAGGMGLAIPGYSSGWFILVSLILMTTGTVFLMWLGEQIDEYGVGNGISLIIMAGIRARAAAAELEDRRLQLAALEQQALRRVGDAGDDTGHDDEADAVADAVL